MAPESSERVALILTEGSTGATGGVETACEVIDWSAGGLGLRSSVFIPRLCQVMVRVSLGGMKGGAAVDFSGRVQRVTMLDRVPTYYLGLLLMGEGPEHERRLARLMEAARRSPPAGEGGGPGA